MAKRRVTRPTPTGTIEAFYLSFLLKIAKELDGLTKELISRLAELYKKQDAEDEKPDPSRVAALIAALQAKYRNPLASPSTLIKSVEQRVNKLTETNVDKQVESVVGDKVLIPKPNTKREGDAFVRRNVALVKSIPKTHFERLENTIREGLNANMRVETLAKTLQDRFISSPGKVVGPTAQARLIARDQVLKYNGQLTQLRHEEAGIEKYIWRTAGDERVRDSHARLEGTTQSWDDPPEVGHPGDDYECRCYAEPILNSDIIGALSNDD